MKAFDVQQEIQKLGRWSNIYVPEFTFGGLRIDALLIDIQHRWIRGFEIKVNKSDFLKDRKWTEYSMFCSTLSIACPAGLIMPEEIKKPFGLLWVEKDGLPQWKKRPQNFQKRDCLAWVFTYLRVLEKELPRLDGALRDLQHEHFRLLREGKDTK